MQKQTYRVRNWSEYNKALIGRGSVTLWMDEDAIEQWYEHSSGEKKRGRPFVYSDIAVSVMLCIKQIYRLPLRATQGFVSSLIDLLKVDIQPLSYTQICRRQSDVELPPLPVLSEGIHMVIDSTGLKIYGEGEWKVRQHGYDKRRTWRKLHIGVDSKSRLIVSELLTKNDCGDDEKLPELLEQYRGKIDQVSADGAYDSHKCHDEVKRRGAIGTIPTQANPKHKPKKKEDIKGARDEVVWEIQTKGRIEWKQESGYHQRSLVENAFYRYKQLLGDKLAARTLKNQVTEAKIRSRVLNKLTTLGMPVSVAVNF